MSFFFNPSVGVFVLVAAALFLGSSSVEVASTAAIDTLRVVVLAGQGARLGRTATLVGGGAESSSVPFTVTPNSEGTFSVTFYAAYARAQFALINNFYSVGQRGSVQLRIVGTDKRFELLDGSASLMNHSDGENVLMAFTYDIRPLIQGALAGHIHTTYSV